MANQFTLGEIRQIRSSRRHHMRMRNICLDQPRHNRDEVVEAIDAIMRCPDDYDATRRVNRILRSQEDYCLCNGTPIANRGPSFTSRVRTDARIPAR